MPTEQFGFTLGQTAVDQVGKMYDDFRLRSGRERGGKGSRLLRQAPIEGILVEDLEAAWDPEVGQTCARLQLLVGAPGERDEVASGSSSIDVGCADNARITDDPSDLVTVVNRSIDLALQAGTYVICLWINGEWRIIWADCGPSQAVSSSGSSFIFTATGGGTLGGPSGLGDGGYGS